MAKSSAKAQRPRGLGKGLSALMSEGYSQIIEEEVLVVEEDNQPAQVQEVRAESDRTYLPLGKLKPGKYQPRQQFDATALSELTESVRRNGVMQPILVRPVGNGTYEIIAGERRWRAAQMAGLSDIPVFIKEMSDETALELALIENIQRKDLNPLEEAAGYQRLMDDFGYTQDMLANTVHKSRSHIANLLRLLALPEDVRQLLEEDKLTMGHARALMNTPNPLALAQEVIRRGLNVRQTEKLANAEKHPSAARPRKSKEPTLVVVQPMEAASAPAVVPIAPTHTASAYHGPKDPDIMALEDTLSENLGLKVGINDRGQSGEIVIAYESLEQLDEILRRLGGSI